MNRYRELIIVTCVAIALTLGGCKGKDHESHEHASMMSEQAPEGHANIIKGKVLQTMNAAGYTYLQLDTGGQKVWAAIPESKVKEGEEVTLVANMELRNFKSKSLNKVFDRIIFATGMTEGSTGEEAPLTNPHGPTGASSMAGGMMGGGSGSLSLPENFHIEKAQGENGYTVGEIYQKRKELNGKTVKVNGYVTKVLTGIMGKNWVHIQDGTGPTKGLVSDLVVTTQDLPNPGDTITVTGKLASDRDFGAGYRYDAIIEDARIDIISKNLQDLSKK